MKQKLDPHENRIITTTVEILSHHKEIIHYKVTDNSMSTELCNRRMIL